MPAQRGRNIHINAITNFVNTELKEAEKKGFLNKEVMIAILENATEDQLAFTFETVNK